ncbi:MAG TPA: tRNA pseudouridine(38-40) synthase TruA [Candidatus Thermoplasmatota archaeon]|nr:tRNA pseudouridine(38-40) synthase TruA [Candidatus Thermoplasmatota archaeon]
MRVALKVAYDGTRFSGSQAQPEPARTVHGELARALAAMGEPAEGIRWAGRTDAGVSAAGNVAVVEARAPPESLLPGLTFRMEDAWAWAWAEVDEAFEPRRASSRWYRYHLRSDLDAAALRDALAPFAGAHDFTSFCRLEAGVDPRRVVRAIDVRRDGPRLLVDVRGDGFLWNQVRRMVEAGRRVAAGELPAGAIEAALREPRVQDLGTAPPEPLVLMDVTYDGLRFSTAKGAGDRLAARMRERLERREDALAVLRAALQPGMGA